MYQGSMARLASLRIIAIEIDIDLSCKRIDLALRRDERGDGVKEKYISGPAGIVNK